jgi:hypothetical protein
MPEILVPLMVRVHPSIPPISNGALAARSSACSFEPRGFGGRSRHRGVSRDVFFLGEPS